VTRPTPRLDHRYPTLALPRVQAGRTRGAAAGNTVGLFLTALVGTALVHLLAYHLPLDVPLGARWISTARDLLIHCPLAGPLGVAVAVAALAPLLALWRIGRLERANATLTRRMTSRHIALPNAGDALPRSPRRLAFFVVVLLALQIPALALADALCLMQVTMVMGGTPMTMMSAPSLPLWLLHALVAAGLGLLLWRVEHRLTQLRTRLAARLRLLLHGVADATAALPAPHASRLLQERHGAALFARPPPTAIARPS